MPSAQKTPLAPSLNRFAERKALDAIQSTGRALPCHVTAISGAIVTVAFDVTGPYTLPQVTMPLFGPEYIRYPIQIGDKGISIPTDAYLGPTSGLGSGASDITMPQANLANLAFLPVGNKNWSSVDPNAVTVYGPNGVVLRNTDATSSITLLPTGIAVIGETYVDVTCGSASITMTTTEVTITDSTNHMSPGTVSTTWNSLLTWLSSHVHSNGNGGADTGAPTTPPPSTDIAPAN